MCGLNGVVRLGASSPPIDEREVLATRDAMKSRGPDGADAWFDPAGLAALGHRRLAIIDLSDRARQPFASADGRHLIVFNGEIYNYKELRSEVLSKGASLRSDSDTEVLLDMLVREGPSALRRARGMFALAMWDRVERRLLLARDPYGIKPLYYADDGGTFRFASQVRALAPYVDGAVDPAGLCGFLLWGAVPEPFTFLRGVKALPAGHALLVEDGRLGVPAPFERLGDEPAPVGGPADAPAALADSVRAHLVADVPVGLFLSAGVDSSLIASLASRASEAPLEAFTLSFDEYEGSSDDELPLAREIARRLGLRHVERRLRRDEFLSALPDVLRAMDQPSIDGFNTYFVSRAAVAAGLKVALSGLGGDELFGSYPSFRQLPRAVRFAKALGRLPGGRSAWAAVARRARETRPKWAGLADVAATLEGAYLVRRALFLPSEIPLLVGGETAREGLGAYEPLAALARYAPETESAGDDWRRVHLLESCQYMRNQLLRDADWASMAHGLEIRVPFADATLRRRFDSLRFEPARSAGKAALLRRVWAGAPEDVLRRAKTGFTIPVARWLSDDPTAPVRRGLESRALAARVLASFGLELPARVPGIPRKLAA